MYQPDNINVVLNSVLKYGSNSIFLSQFLEICINISRINFLNSKYRVYLTKKTGCTIDDLAVDLIADLFADKNGKFCFLNRYFKDIRSSVMKLPKSVLTSRLFSLISSASGQRISDLRQEFGENYFKIKKAVDICLTRKPDKFKKKKYKDNIYVYDSSTKSLNLKFEQMPKEYLIPELYRFEYKTYQIPEVMTKIYNVVKHQKNYCKALELTFLINCVVEFYKNRMESHLNIGPVYYAQPVYNYS